MIKLLERWAGTVGLMGRGADFLDLEGAEAEGV